MEEHVTVERGMIGGRMDPGDPADPTLGGAVPSIKDKPTVRIAALLLLVGIAASIILPVVVAVANRLT